jgi:hypothetical protein
LLNWGGALCLLCVSRCKAEMVERAYDAHLKQFVIMADPVTGAKLPVKCKEHSESHPKVCGCRMGGGRNGDEDETTMPLCTACCWHVR